LAAAGDIRHEGPTLRADVKRFRGGTHSPMHACSTTTLVLGLLPASVRDLADGHTMFVPEINLPKVRVHIIQVRGRRDGDEVL